MLYRQADTLRHEELSSCWFAFLSSPTTHYSPFWDELLFNDSDHSRSGVPERLVVMWTKEGRRHRISAPVGTYGLPLCWPSYTLYRVKSLSDSRPTAKTSQSSRSTVPFSGRFPCSGRAPQPSKHWELQDSWSAGAIMPPGRFRNAAAARFLAVLVIAGSFCSS